MAIRFTCPACRAVYDLPDTLLGKRVRCSECRAEFRVNTAPTAEAADLPAAADGERRAERLPVVEEEVRDRPSPRPPARRRLPPDEEDAPRPRKRKPAAKDDRPRRREQSAPVGLIVGGIAGGVLLLLAVASVWLVFGRGGASPDTEQVARADGAKDKGGDPNGGGNGDARPPAPGVKNDPPRVIPPDPVAKNDPPVVPPVPIVRDDAPPGRPADPPLPRLRPIKSPPPAPYQPHLPEAEKAEVPLSGPVADAAVGGGGRYLILRLAGKKKLAVFDVQLGKVAKELPLAEDEVHIAAGANRLAVIFPGAKLIQLWNLTTLERERSALLPGTLTSDTIHQICMGSASAGPLFVYLPKEKRTLAVDLGSLETAEVRWTNWAPTNAYGPLNMRSAPDGTRLIGWGGGWAGCEVAMFSDGEQVGSHAKIEFWAAEGTFALPSADGRFLFTPWGILNRAFVPTKAPELKGAYVVPAVEPGYFLSLAGQSNPGTEARTGQEAGEAAVYTEDRKQLFFLKGLDEIKVRADLPWEKRIYYYPRAGLLVTLGAEKDRLVLRRVSLADQLEKSGADYLVVVSRPPTAKAGALFAYRLEVRSKKGGVKVKLESGPPGLKVTEDGQVSWNVPAKPEQPEADVLVTLSDATGQQAFHTFTIAVAKP